MTSLRRHKKRLARSGRSGTEDQLAALVTEMLDELRWLKVLAFSNQWLWTERAGVAPDERDRVFAAAARVVERDPRLQDWRARLERLRAGLQQVGGEIAASRKTDAAAGSEGAAG
jgi:hypothetical protein